MANWTILKAAIASVIKTNGNQEITGAVLQNTLNNIVNAVGENATFAGIATPATSPGTPDGPVFYLALEKGVYSNFAGAELNGKEFTVFYNNSNGTWLHSSLGETGSGNVVGMNPYFPFAESATFYENTNTKTGLSKEEAQNFIFGIYIDEGKRTDQMYLGRLETNRNNISARFAINGTEVLIMNNVSNSIDELVIRELIPTNSSGYHGWIALIPANRINGTFITSSTGGTFEKFALSEHIFNTCPLFSSYFNGENIAKNANNIEDLRISLYDTTKTNTNNLLDYWYEREHLCKLIRDHATNNLEDSKVFVESCIVPESMPSRFYGQKCFILKNTEYVNHEKQVLCTIASFYLRKLSNISVDTWLFIGNETNRTHNIIFEIALHASYPYNSIIDKWNYSFMSTTDYSSAKESPITVYAKSTSHGNMSIVIDDFMEADNGVYFHISCTNSIDDEYSHISIIFKHGYVIANDASGVGRTKMVINPIISTTDHDYIAEEYTTDNYLYTPLAINKGISNIGSQGHIDRNGVFRYALLNKPIQVTSDIRAEIVENDNQGCVDIKFSSDENLAVSQSNVQNQYAISFSYWMNKDILKIGDLYFQYKIDFNDVYELYDLYANPSTNNVAIYEPIITAQGLVINNSNNNYSGKVSRIVDVTKDGIITVRNYKAVSADNNSLNLGFSLRYSAKYEAVVKSILYKDLVIAPYPPMINGPRTVPENKITRGKTFMLFGDSEFNFGSQFKISVERLGMKAIIAAYGGHSMGYNTSYNSSSGVGDGNSWLYAWEYREAILNAKADFYIFCVSTNDSNAGIKLEENKKGLYDYQSINDDDITYVLDNYPSYGDTEEEIANKKAVFALMDNTALLQKFNMTSVYCAYIEQILEVNPKAKIILANSPITCTGLLTGKTDNEGKGVWIEGENAKTARQKKAPIFDRLSELMHKIADKYNLPVIDFYHNVGLTFENYIHYCIDGTHWTDIKNTSNLTGINYIGEREGDMICKYLSDMGS